MPPLKTAFFNNWFIWLKGTWVWPGIEEVGRFVGTHLISGMIPAFFIAGAIGVFLDKQRITRLMGPTTSPFISYPLSALAGAILTVCSCGVIPIFTGILQQGAGIGPAFTFLFAAPAVNLIALTYTFTYMGLGFTIARIVAVLIISVMVGVMMRLTFSETTPEAVETLEVVEDEDEKSDFQLLVFFALLVLIMLTSTGVFDSFLKTEQRFIHSPMLSSRTIITLDFLLAKISLIICEICVLAIAVWRWFHAEEIKQWLKKSWSLFVMIFPTVLLGIFISGLLAALLPLTRYMSIFSSNSLAANLLASVIGALMYFGTIVGVNIVATLVHFGMHLGPALALILSAPAMSLPSVLTLQRIVGFTKAWTFLLYIVFLTTAAGLIYGSLM